MINITQVIVLIVLIENYLEHSYIWRCVLSHYVGKTLLSCY